MHPMTRLACTAAAMISATPALAHTQDTLASNALFSGLLHPLTGLDHLLAMLAMGGWMAAQTTLLKRSMTASFLMMLLVGFVLGVNGFVLPYVESGIAASVLVLGLLAGSALSAPAAVSLSVAGLFAIFHGVAHGTEVSGSVVYFAAGFLTTSATLIATGALVTQQLKTQLPMLPRIAGFAIAASGLSMLAG